MLGGFYGVEALLPLADVDVTTAFGPNGHKAGVGDLTVSPLILEWHHTLFGMPYFHRFALDIVLPTGQYDRNRAVNVGNNVVSVNPYYALTLVPAGQFEVSARLHYLWNSINHDPFVGLQAQSIQPGQAGPRGRKSSFALPLSFNAASSTPR